MRTGGSDGTASDDSAVADLRVLHHRDDAVANVEPRSFALLNAAAIRDHAAVPDRGILVHDRVLDPRPLTDTGIRWPLHLVAHLRLLPPEVVGAHEHGAVNPRPAIDEGANADDGARDLAVDDHAPFPDQRILHTRAADLGRREHP